MSKEIKETVQEEQTEVNIFEIYGKLMVEQEILNGKISEVKKAIANNLNKNI